MAAVILLSPFSLLGQPNDSVFKQEFLGDSARVTTSQNIPRSAWAIKCREALGFPLQNQLRQQLEEQLGVVLPEGVSYLEGSVENYQSWNKSKWLHCKGDVSIDDEEKHLAALAVRGAWALANKDDNNALLTLIKYAMQHTFSSADAVVLVAKLASADEQLSYLDQHLDSSALTLDEAKETVLQIWDKEQRWAAIIELAEQCNSLGCRRLSQRAEEKKEQEDAIKANDLSSYF